MKIVDDGETILAVFPADPWRGSIHVRIDAVANGCIVRFRSGPLVKRRLENSFGSDVFGINAPGSYSCQSPAQIY